MCVPLSITQVSSTVSVCLSLSPSEIHSQTFLSSWSLYLSISLLVYFTLTDFHTQRISLYLSHSKCLLSLSLFQLLFFFFQSVFLSESFSLFHMSEPFLFSLILILSLLPYFFSVLISESLSLFREFVRVLPFLECLSLFLFLSLSFFFSHTCTYFFRFSLVASHSQSHYLSLTHILLVSLGLSLCLSPLLPHSGCVRVSLSHRHTKIL